MIETTVPDALGVLNPLVGQWRMDVGFDPNAADELRAVTTFEWLSGRRFLIQRWEVDHPDAPDGIAIMGFNPQKNGLVQNYFDSRGVARVYDMAFADKVWTLQRYGVEPDCSQRFIGRFSDDDDVITGRWERSDDGSSWSHDFDLIYSRVG